ncbi:hypothetical protein PCASD_15461 [Puccinia coronata f. sp. avenae]|uniref:Uncharacterized protein n=1 Tax=Puccinia coronata f. sp. avenae TaxID=200324 RepID=A0A2N5UPH7_9BASI|nr:hypothetical protein PCASD_15461 [Puccinia coronata f. sp. avenae]
MTSVRCSRQLSSLPTASQPPARRKPQKVCPPLQEELGALPKNMKWRAVDPVSDSSQSECPEGGKAKRSCADPHEANEEGSSNTHQYSSKYCACSSQDSDSDESSISADSEIQAIFDDDKEQSKDGRSPLRGKKKTKSKQPLGKGKGNAKAKVNKKPGKLKKREKAKETNAGGSQGGRVVTHNYPSSNREDNSAFSHLS